MAWSHVVLRGPSNTVAKLSEHVRSASEVVLVDACAWKSVPDNVVYGRKTARAAVAALSSRCQL